MPNLGRHHLSEATSSVFASASCVVTAVALTKFLMSVFADQMSVFADQTNLTTIDLQHTTCRFLKSTNAAIALAEA